MAYLELLLDKLEAGEFCTCLDKQKSEVRLFNEMAHYNTCVGNLKLSELIYEDKWQNTISTK